MYVSVVLCTLHYHRQLSVAQVLASGVWYPVSGTWYLVLSIGMQYPDDLSPGLNRAGLDRATRRKWSA